MITTPFEDNRLPKRDSYNTPAIKRQLWMYTLIISPIIIAVIAAFIIPTFLSWQTRAKVSRARADQQSLAAGIEAYFVNMSSYPPPDIDVSGRFVIPHVITTPVAFLIHLYKDPFMKNGTGLYGYAKYTTYSYFSGQQGSQESWIVTSYGPDHVDGNLGIPWGTSLDESKAVTDESLGFPLQSSGLTYDPTNGTNSPGDIWRRGPF